jgi:hypothetical protein
MVELYDAPLSAPLRSTTTSLYPEFTIASAEGHFPSPPCTKHDTGFKYLCNAAGGLV